MTGVMIILGQLGYGGSELQVLYLVRGINRDKYRIMVVSLTGSSALISDKKVRSFTESVRASGTEVIVCGKKHRLDVFRLFRLAGIMKESKIDIVCTYGFSAGLWGRTAALLAGVPVLIAGERSTTVDRSLTRFLADWILAFFTDRIVANALAVADYVHRRSKINREKILVIHNGVDLERFRPFLPSGRLRRELGIPDGSLVVGMTGNMFFRYKGQKYFLEAIEKVKRSFPDTRFLLVGDGPLISEYRDYSRRLGISDRVIFAGPRTDIPEVLSLTDVFVSSSLTEGFSNVILEAMAMALPAVVTDVGGNAEAVIDGINGYVVPPADSAAIAKAVIDLLQDRQKISKMGLAGRKRIEEHFSMDKMVKRYEELYDYYLEKKFLKNRAVK